MVNASFVSHTAVYSGTIRLLSVLSYGLFGLQMDCSYLPLDSPRGRVTDGMSNDLDL